MIVSEARYAAGYVDAKAGSVLFDDVGEALAAVRERPSLKDILYVNDIEEPEWFPAREAFFVHAQGFTTPMGSGIAVFRTGDRAAAFSDKRGASAPVGLADALDRFR